MEKLHAHYDVIIIKALSFALFLILDMSADAKVRGVLQKEKNGFCWYLYKNKEAYSLSGEKLFADEKGIQYIKFLSNGSDDKGFFLVKTKKHKTAYSPTGKYITNARISDIMGRSEIWSPKLERYEYYVSICRGAAHREYYNDEGVKVYSGDGYPTTQGDYVLFNVNGETYYDYSIYHFGGKLLSSGTGKLKYLEDKKLFLVTNGKHEVSVIDSLGKRRIRYAKKIIWGKSAIFFDEGYDRRGAGIMDYNGNYILEPQESLRLGKEIILPNGQKFYNIEKWRKPYYEGIFNEFGEYIIPIEMDRIEIFDDTLNIFKIKKGDYYGLVSPTGKEIIPLSRHYTLIYQDPSKKGIFRYTTLACRGECDKNGVEISRELSDSSSSREKPEESKHDKSNSLESDLLYSGMYTISGQGRSGSSGQFTDDLGDQTCEIEIYKDYILVCGISYDLKSKSGAKRIYQGSGAGVSFNGMSCYDTFTVDANFNIRKTTTFSSPYGSDTFSYSISKGETTMLKFSNTSSSNNSRGSYNNRNAGNQRTGSTSNRRACTNCKFTNGKCPVCKGTRKIQGSFNSKVDCNHCGGSGICPKCNGTGYVN